MAPPTPLEGIYAAVTRRTLDDKNPGGWVPEQRIGVEDALRAYTPSSSADPQRAGHGPLSWNHFWTGRCR